MYNGNEKNHIGYLKIGQINLARSRVATEELSRFTVESGLNVVLVQEPYTHKGRVTGLGTGTRIAQAALGTPWAAIAVYREDCTVVQLENVTTNYLAAVHVAMGSLRINLVSTYYRAYRTNKRAMRRALRETTRTLNQLNNDGVIIGADTNAKSALWHSGNTDERGRKLEQFIAQKGLTVVNEQQDYCTFQGPAGKVT